MRNACFSFGRMRRLNVVWCGISLLALVGCSRTPTVTRVIPGVSTGAFAELSESALDAMVFCHDTLGRPLGKDRTVAVSLCTPCIPYGLRADATKALAHARRLWLQRARAPYDTTDLTASCARLAYRYARTLAPDDDSVFVEYAMFRLADERPSLRAEALRDVDDRLRELQNAGEEARARRILVNFARNMWDRAQRELERPGTVHVEDIEARAHDLAAAAPPLSRLPSVPATSPELGVSEAEWVARLYTQLAQSAGSPAERSRYLRFALAPWVALRDWKALDSAAHAISRFAVADSAVLPAIALAAYYRIDQPTRDSPRAFALFDSALRAMPRVDSARYDSFDAVLTARDDEWRYGYVPGDRLLLDARGWAMLDPVWSTPVNEIRLARRARVAEADYRYADIARANESGSETEVGQLLLRLGSPDDRWVETARPFTPTKLLSRGWNSMTAVAVVDDLQESWRMFYSPAFSLQRAARYRVERSTACKRDDAPELTLVQCAVQRRADWVGVPYYGNTDTIDVALARFRATADSMDVYLGARVPMRGFSPENDLHASPRDSIVLGMWLTDELGQPLHQRSVPGPLPRSGEIARTMQWTARVGRQSTLHRVEAIEPRRAVAARGVAQFTSDAQIAFPTRGFGMSDVLTAATIAPRTRGVPLRWSDLTVVPNGGVITPGQRIALAWETYNLKPGADGRVRWRVQIKRERGALVANPNLRDALSASARAGTKVLANEADASDVSFTRDAPSSDVVVDFIRALTLEHVPIGRHVLNVRVEDLVAHTTVTRSISFRVLDPESQRRGTLYLKRPPLRSESEH